MIDTFLVLDVETTGLDYAEDRVIEWGLASFHNKQLAGMEGGYIQSDVPNRGQHINNITPEQIASGEPQKEAMKYLWWHLVNLVQNRWPLCAYNAAFDLSFMAYSFARCGIEFDFSELRVLDPLVIHRHYDRKDWAYKSGARKLIRMAERYSTGHTPDHTAKMDAVVAGELMIELNYHFPFGSYSSLALHRLQKTWATEWGEGLRKLVHPKPVKLTEWPVEIPCSPQESSEQLQLSLLR